LSPRWPNSTAATTSVTYGKWRGKPLQTGNSMAKNYRINLQRASDKLDAIVAQGMYSARQYDAAERRLVKAAREYLEWITGRPHTSGKKT
jgi:TPR repeat protein